MQGCALIWMISGWKGRTQRVTGSTIDYVPITYVVHREQTKKLRVPFLILQDTETIHIIS